MLKRFSHIRPWQTHPNLIFWLCFGTLNALLFLPLYLLTQENTSFFPGAAITADGLWLGANRLFLWRDNLDPFRISLELTVLCALWVSVRWLRRRPLRVIFVIVYLLALCYAIYEAIMVTVYRVDPVFYSHYFLALDGLPFLAEIAHVAPWIYALALVGLLTVIAAVAILVNVLLSSADQAGFRRASRVAMVILAGLCLFATLRYQVYTASPEMVVSSLGFKLHKNINASLQLHQDVVKFDDAPARRAYAYVNRQMAQTPDIYLIFVESYGSVLYKRADFRASYTALLRELEEQLHDTGWQASSALSDSPTWGGGSWMAYTSLLLGLRIDSHPQYLSLLNKYQVDTYPDMGRTLRKQGYYYAWVSSISRELDEQMWSKYERFLGVDQWLRYEDLEYSGPQYSWGPAPPDQYVLNYAAEKLQASTDKPLLFVTITQNSHYPWLEQPPLVEDWRTLRKEGFNEQAVSAKEQEEMQHSTRRQNYLAAIDYQLRMLVDFVQRNGDDNSIFILVGDHQPPRVSRRSDGWDTPIHIISKDQALLDAFGEYGFHPGLRVNEVVPSLRHEGFYSLFMRVLFKRNGVEQLALPTYLPGGATQGATPADTN
jgi:phosphoglycerol transferase MdoB-like AlkP superfamily enzyme